MKALKLNKLFILFFPFVVFSQTDNKELEKMFGEDQNSRMKKNIDWVLLTKQDRERENKVYELIKSGEIVTGKDFYNSAMIFQHGRDSISHGMAVKHMKRAIELDSTIDKWLLAAAIDRNLLSRNKPQIYGTQYLKMNGENWKRSPIDTTQVTDKERKLYHVESLSEQVEKIRNMNLLAISEFHYKFNSIEKTVKFINSENKKGLKSTYNISEDELNTFGYELIESKKTNEALEIFLINTKLHPKSYNAFDSLGECLFILEKKEEAIKAYKKSLELNPKNENAKKKISEKI